MQVMCDRGAGGSRMVVREEAGAIQPPKELFLNGALHYFVDAHYRYDKIQAC